MSAGSPAPNLKACSIEKIALCIIKYLKIINQPYAPYLTLGRMKELYLFIKLKTSGLFKKREGWGREECF